MKTWIQSLFRLQTTRRPSLRRRRFQPEFARLEDRCVPAGFFADFNGDSYDDLAIGAPGQSNTRGAVSVLYGSAAGLSATNNQFWTQDSPLVENFGEIGDQFGAALATGDFNGDRFADLAIGVPGENGSAGGVNVLYGSSAGLTAAGDQEWTQATINIEGEPEFGDRFGSALAVGDFNHDHFADLAIGVPGEDIGTQVDAGAVNVLYGSPAGLSATGDQLWSQNSAGIEGASEPTDFFGSALAAGDFNRDGNDDLAIGVPGEAEGSVNDVGAVNVIYGSPTGLAATSNQSLDRNILPFRDGRADDQFGTALTVEDFDGDTFADLAVGAPGPLAGHVTVLFGRPGRFSVTTGLMTSRRRADGVGFGSALVALHSDADPSDELVVGSPSADPVPLSGGRGVEDAGNVNIFVNFSSGNPGLEYTQFSQDTPDDPEVFDRFGISVSAGDFNGDGKDDLVVGVDEDGTGGVHVNYGGNDFPFHANQMFWTLDSPGVLGAAQVGDQFGLVLVGSPLPAGAGFSGVWLGVDAKHHKKHSKLDATLEVTNPGLRTADRSVVRYYLSDDATLDDGDALLSETKLGTLQPGEKKRIKLHAKLPAGSAVKYLIAVLDATNAVPELNERNNVIVSGPLP